MHSPVFVYSAFPTSRLQYSRVTKMYLRFSLLFVFACLVLAGCTASGPATNRVKGKVSFQDEPIKEGQIFFDSADKTIPSATAAIKDGEYTAAVVNGKYKVRINATKMLPYPPGVKGASGEKEGPQQFLPARFNDKSDLTADVSGARNDLDFILK